MNFSSVISYAIPTASPLSFGNILAPDKTVAWLDESQQATKEEYEEHQKELEAVANPIMMKFYGANSGEGGMPGAMPGGGFPGAGGPGATHDDGPTVEEVD